MSIPQPRESLRTTIAKARRRIFALTFLVYLVRATLILLPLAAVAVAADQYFLRGRWSDLAVYCAAGMALVTALVAALRARGSFLHTAVAIDERADLKGRVSSAWEFLVGLDRLESPHLAQIRDAASHAQTIDVRSVFGLSMPRYALLVPVLAMLLVLSFYVPSRVLPQTVEAAVDVQKARQLNELRQLQEELKLAGDEEKELKDVIEKLRQVEERFDQGELKDRDVMIELARLDEDLSRKMAQLGVDKLDGEVQQVLPHLMASAASRAAASKLKEGRPDQAAQEMEKLAEQMNKGELSEKDKQDMAMNMAVAASKLGTPSKNSLSGDLSQASEALKSEDAKSFEGAAKSMGSKFKNLAQYKKMQSMRKRISMAKSGLGQKECSNCNGQGCSMCNGAGKSGQSGGQKGGLRAGTETAGDPRGDRSRLEDSYRQLVKVSGMAGEGPVSSEVEAVEGETSERQIGARELYSEYAAVAEEAIERDEIPLSHRFHVKRYFQAIRPTE